MKLVLVTLCCLAGALGGCSLGLSRDDGRTYYDHDDYYYRNNWRQRPAYGYYEPRPRYYRPAPPMIYSEPRARIYVHD